VVLKPLRLAFGGDVPPITGATEEYNGTSWATSPGSLNTAKIFFRSSRNTNSSFSFWWKLVLDLIQELQRNMMVQLGQASTGSLNTARKSF
jgi:hypothetical protein